jgi:bleomycin hydrolase
MMAWGSDYESAFGIAPHLSKSERLQTGDSAMTHAMVRLPFLSNCSFQRKKKKTETHLLFLEEIQVITAVHLDAEGNPIRFKVENSWSDTAGDHGYFMMTNAWFDEFVYQIVIPKLVVPSDLKKVYEEAKPLVLPAWGPSLPLFSLLFLLWIMIMLILTPFWGLLFSA